MAVVPALIAFVATMGAGLVAIKSYPVLSPVDELQHLDYVLRVSQGELVLAPGEQVGDDAMRIQACRGIDAAFVSPPCDSSQLKPEQFQELGINTAARGVPSPFYLASGGIVSVLRAAGLDDFVAARIASLLGHAAGAATVALLVAVLSQSSVLGAGLGTLVGVMPPMLSQGSTVNPDAWALLAGATFVALTVWRHRLKFPVWVILLAVATFVVGLTKPNWFLLAVVPFMAVVSDWWADRASVRPRELVAIIGVGFLGLVVLLGTTAWSSHLAAGRPEAPMSQYLAISPENPFDIPGAVASTFQAVVPFSQYPVVDSLENQGAIGLSFLWGVLFSGAALLAVFMASVGSHAFALALGGIATLIGSPLFVYVGQYVAGVFFAYPQRYSFYAIPIVAVALAAMRPGRAVLLGITALASSAWFIFVGLVMA